MVSAARRPETSSAGMSPACGVIVIRSSPDLQRESDRPVASSAAPLKELSRQLLDARGVADDLLDRHARGARCRRLLHPGRAACTSAHEIAPASASAARRNRDNLFGSGWLGCRSRARWLSCGPHRKRDAHSVQKGLLSGTRKNVTLRPNFLFIVADDLNSWIGALGRHPDVKTPNIDALAARGTLFTNAYCAAPYCNASRMSVFTGCLPSTTGIYVNEPLWEIPGRRRTFIERLREAGYFTMGAGKVFHGVFDYNEAGRSKLPRAKWVEMENRPTLWDLFISNVMEPLPDDRPLKLDFRLHRYRECSARLSALRLGTASRRPDRPDAADAPGRDERQRVPKLRTEAALLLRGRHLQTASAVARPCPVLRPRPTNRRSHFRSSKPTISTTSRQWLRAWRANRPRIRW